jgi:hypothetical protein
MLVLREFGNSKLAGKLIYQYNMERFNEQFQFNPGTRQAIAGKKEPHHYYKKINIAPGTISSLNVTRGGGSSVCHLCLPIIASTFNS